MCMYMWLGLLCFNLLFSGQIFIVLNETHHGCVTCIFNGVSKVNAELQSCVRSVNSSGFRTDLHEDQMETEMDLEMVFLALTYWDLLARTSFWIKCILVKGMHKPIPADFRQIVTKKRHLLANCDVTNYC